MALIIKDKSLKYLVDVGCSANLVAMLKDQGVSCHFKEGNSLTLWHGDTGYKMAGPLSLAGASLHAGYVLAEIAKVSAPVQISAQQPVPGVVPLRDAKAMYQRVMGTSGGSVYVVVALASELKLAARMVGDGLSVRAEGDALNYPETKVRLAQQGLVHKVAPTFNYMSGHYTCNAEAPPQKVLGAILLGSGIAFDTPIPNINTFKMAAAQ